MSRKTSLVALQGPADEWSPSPGVKALSLAEQVAAAIGQAILDDRFAPGERVHEVDVSKRFSVSRAPVREALRILERDGLVEIVPRRGARVTSLKIDEVDEVFELRAALMRVAARRLAERGDPAIHRALGQRIDALRTLARGAEIEPYVREVQALNRMFVDACGNRFVRSMFLSMAHRTLRYARLGLASETRRVQSSRKWKQLRLAIEAGDVDLAQNLAESLVLDSRAMAIAVLRAAPPVAAARARRRPSGSST